MTPEAGTTALTESLAGTVAVVTGAAGGIGAATASALGARGAALVLGDRDADGLARVATGLRAQGLDVEVEVGDLTRDADCGRLVGSALARYGRLDVLVNNAGIGVFGLTLESTTEAVWDQVVAVNLKSVFLMSRHGAAAMRAGGGGVIVNVASVHAQATAAGVIPYAAAKGGVVSMTRAMAIDLAPHLIRVVAILPGATDTPMLQAQAAAEGKTYEQLGFARDRATLARIADPPEIAAVIAFAASPAGSAITGSTITADCGLLAGF